MSDIIQDKPVQKKRMLSGIKPSGDLTLGSYLGAVKNWAERAEEYDCFVDNATKLVVDAIKKYKEKVR